MQNVMNFNGIKLPTIGDEIWVITPVLKADKRGKLYASRNKHEIELVKASVIEAKLNTSYRRCEDGSGERECVYYEGIAATTDAAPYRTICFNTETYAISQEAGEVMLEFYRNSGFMLVPGAGVMVGEELKYADIAFGEVYKYDC